ncbi:MAG: hypothetical protein ABJN26_05500 [Stappiaceae bacterium]
MHEEKHGPTDWSADIEFLRANVTATNILLQGLIDQNAIDYAALEKYFLQRIENMPGDRSTLATRLVLDQWCQGMKGSQQACSETPESELSAPFEVIVGGRAEE